ncbi:MAG TPA: hypothetical protein VNB22_11225 [Pyrinomonadaceae bacterium]|jgi:hypothetical protein|nr:hypothetical protein [Pyrinomonadaceae bacterium]
MSDKFVSGIHNYCDRWCERCTFTARCRVAEAESGMLSIIYWYPFFISAKIQRGFHGFSDFDGNPDKEELNDSQSDTSGSIKIALIAVERSIMAWTALMTKENSANIKPHISLLEAIKQKAETKFPNARDFVRPGFDEVETVM